MRADPEQVPDVEAGMSPSSNAIKIGKYTPLVVLGRGGMGTVYLAVARGPAGFNKLQVVKYLRAELAEDEEFLSMFMDEARLSASINHPNVVQTNEVGKDDEQYFIAMEYVEGKTLLSILGRAKKLAPLPLGMHLRILCDALTGLHCAHELNDIDGKPLHVVHRDVSPQNVMVSYDGQVKVLDFGIAKAANSSSETRTGVLKGKFGYMAPEQMMGEAADRRADIFAAGVMLWQALTNQRLWKVGMSDMEIFSKVTSGDIPKPSDVAEVPAELERVCMRALAMKPKDRHATAAELQQDLEAWLQSSGDRTTSRDIGTYLNSLYGEDRRKLKGIVEERLRAVRAGEASDTIPTLVPTGGGGDSGARSAERSGGGAVLTSTVPGDSAATKAPPRRATTAIVVALTAAAAVGVVFSIRSKTTPARVEATANDTSADAEAGRTEVKFALTPADAAVFVDDRAVPLTAGSASLPRDNAVHTLRIEASGYSSVSQPVTLDSPKVFVSISLEKLGASASATPPSVASAAPAPPPVIKAAPPVRGRPGPKHEGASEVPAPTSSPATTSEPAKSPAVKKKDPLDTGDPWK